MSDRTSPDSGPELLPCPFCGGPATLTGFPHGIIGKVCCKNDDCFGPRTTAVTKRDSIIQWNTRGLAPRPKEQKYIRVGWFNPYNDYHGFQQVHRSYEGGEGTFPLFCRESDLGKTDLPGAASPDTSTVCTIRGAK